MNQESHNRLVSFIWSIADDCLRDVYVRGKYRDVILPMVVLRRLDALLENSKDELLEEVRFQKEEMELTELDTTPIKQITGFVFFNTSPWTLKKLNATASNSTQILEANFAEYLNGFSPNVIEIIQKFKLREQISHMASKDVLLDVLEKFTSAYINLTNHEREDPEGQKLPALSNLGMGYVFEELIRKFNEENNEEAGEHFTPREVIELMTHIIFCPIKDKLPPVISIYDPACGSGGMLTESQKFIVDPEGAICADSSVYLFGKEINDETYAICKSDMMIKGENPENIKNGSTLSTDEFAGTTFHFMLSNPPYGKSWASEQRYIKDGKDVIDPRFIVNLADYWGEVSQMDAVPRSSDGQLLFLMEMVSKMKSLSDSPIGSRIASVHNGSSLFTGDAGGGESNIRRYIIENDMLEAIIQLPNNLFYNTGITTYIWILSNHKSTKRQGKVQLIDASELYRKLRKNLGDKNCEFAPEHIQEIINVYENLTKQKKDKSQKLASKIFDNSDFGYYKVNIQRPKRLKSKLSTEKIEELKYDKSLYEPMRWAYSEFEGEFWEEIANHKEPILKWCEEQELNLKTKQKNTLTSKKIWEKHQKLYNTALKLQELIGTEEFNDFNLFKSKVDSTLKEHKIKLSASEKKQILNAISWYDQGAKKVIKKVHKLSKDKLTTLLNHLGCKKEELGDFGYYQSDRANEYIEYESESDLRDSENIPLKSDIYSYFLEEVKPNIAEAWIDIDSVKIGYEISFNRYFYEHKPLRSIEEVTADIVELERLSDGLIAEILGL
jgi:type I restriction enzyme M protein